MMISIKTVIKTSILEFGFNGEGKEAGNDLRFNINIDNNNIDRGYFF